MVDVLLEKYFKCPICQGELDIEISSRDNFSSESCRADKRDENVIDDHTYIQSVSKDSGQVERIIVRVGMNEEKYYIRTGLYTQHYTQIWKGKFKASDIARSLVLENKFVVPNYSDGTAGILKQLKLYLTFA